MKAISEAPQRRWGSVEGLIGFFFRLVFEDGDMS